MKHRSALRTAALAGAAALVSTSAFAQAQPARPAQATAPAATTLTNPGPVIPGVCIMSSERAIATSAVGRAVVARLQVLNQQVTAELTPQRNTLQTEMTQLEQQRATLQPAQLQQRTQALQTRYETFQNLGQLRAAEMQQTQVAALRRIESAMQPIVNNIYGQRRCGILIERGTVVAANPQMDITDAVIQAMNTSIQPFSFERERINPQQAAAAARQ